MSTFTLSRFVTALGACAGFALGCAPAPVSADPGAFHVSDVAPRSATAPTFCKGSTKP